MASANTPSKKPKKTPVKKTTKKKSAAKKGKPTEKDRLKLRQRNLAAFEKHQPDLHAKLVDFKPISRLEFDDAGLADAVFNDQYFYNRKADTYVAEQMKGFWRDPVRFSIATLTPQQFDTYAGKFLHNVVLRGTEAGMEFAPSPVTEEAYFVLSFGIGLAGHLDPLIERTNCQALVLVEPNLEFLSLSLEVYDWKALFEHFEKIDGKVAFYIDNNPEALSRNIRYTVRGTNPCSLDGMYVFSHYNNAIFSKTSQILLEDRDLIVAGLGFLDDEILMIKNAHGNLYPGTSRLYLRPPEKFMSLPAFIVGSGPSLDRDIAFIKDNADKAIILSCGSAIRPLMVNGIVPDFQIEVENDGAFPLIAQVAAEHDLSSVTLLCSVTGERQVLQFFENIVFYMRGSLSPYPIWNQTESQTLRYCNPTVTNAGISFAQEIGCREFYMFGTDMGSMNPDVHHSKDAYHYTEGAVFADQTYSIPIPGNFGGTCYTSMGLYWARDSMANAMKSIAIGRTYFNCSNGALIDGTVTKGTRSIELDEVDGGKHARIDEIVDGFPVYSAETFDAFWQDDVMVKSFTNYIQTVREAFEGMANFADKGYLTELIKILEDTSTRELAAMALLYRGSIYMSVMCFEYYRERLTDRERIEEFDQIGKQELIDLVNWLRDTTVEAVGTLSAEAGPRDALKASA